jgi:hypothetical protein
MPSPFSCGVIERPEYSRCQLFTGTYPQMLLGADLVERTLPVSGEKNAQFAALQSGELEPAYETVARQPVTTTTPKILCGRRKPHERKRGQMRLQQAGSDRWNYRRAQSKANCFPTRCGAVFLGPCALYSSPSWKELRYVSDSPDPFAQHLAWSQRRLKKPRAYPGGPSQLFVPGDSSQLVVKGYDLGQFSPSQGCQLRPALQPAVVLWPYKLGCCPRCRPGMCGFRHASRQVLRTGRRSFLCWFCLPELPSPLAEGSTPDQKSTWRSLSPA